MPAHEARTPITRLRHALPAGLFLLGSMQFAIHYVWVGLPFLNLRLYTREGIPMPYQGRILIAWLFQATAGNPAVYDFLARHGAHLPMQLRDPFVIVQLLTTFGALLIAGLACQATVYALCKDRTLAAWSPLVLLAQAALVSFFDMYELWTLPYDIPAIGLFSLALFLVLTDRLLLLIPVFVLGTLNRETFLFISVFTALYHGFRASEHGHHFFEGLRHVLPTLICQIVFWGTLRVWLVHRFRHNGNDVNASRGFNVQIATNLHSMLNPSQWPLLLITAAPLVLPLILGWRWISNRALAQASAVVMALWVVGMLFVGVLVEVRIFNELTTLATLCMASVLWTRFVQPSRTYLQHGSVRSSG